MKRYNVLLITGDHVRSDVLAATDGTHSSQSLAAHVRTPHLDALASQGVAFRHCFSPDPICVPARAAITTGRYPHKCLGSKGNSGSIHADDPRLAEHFASHGYDTCAIGKLHYLPYAPPGQPRTLHGFQHAELCEEGRIIGKYDPDGQTRGLEDYHDYLHSVNWGGYERSHGVGNNDVHPGLSALPAEHHEETWVASRAIHWLEQRQRAGHDQPWLMWASFIKPHPPYDPPAPYDRMYDPRSLPAPLGDDESLMAGRDAELQQSRLQYGWDKLAPEAIRTSRAMYAGLMSLQDAMIGRLLTYLKTTGQDKDTIILYTADHGDLLGDFNRFFKSNMFDASVKVPMLIHVPGLPPAQQGQQRDQLVGLQDILPTLCDLTGLPIPASVDGQSLQPLLEDAGAAGREAYIAQTGNAPCQKYMVRTAKWKYVYTQVQGRQELYDVTRRNSELTNLAADPAHQDTLEALRAKLIAWCQAHGDDQMLENGDLALSPLEAAGEASFKVGRLGWRKY